MRKINNNIYNKMQKREGNFTRLPSGSYRLTFGYEGKLYRDTFTDIKDDFEAEIRLREYVQTIKDNLYDSLNITVASWAQTWIDKKIRPNTSGTKTAEDYIKFLNNRFLERCGNKKLKNITMEDLNNYFTWLKTQNTNFDNRENTPLSEGSLIKYHGIIHSMFECAYLWNKIPINPCPKRKSVNFKVNNDGSARKKPKNSINEKNQADIQYFSQEDYQKALRFLELEENEIICNNSLSEKQKHFYYGRLLAFELDFKTGLRRSELYALKKSDIDINNAVLKVDKTRQRTASRYRYFNNKK